MNRYFVPVYADVRMTMTGEVEVYAPSEPQAVAKVQDQIDADILSDDLEMEDAWSGSMLRYELVKHIDGVNIEVDTAGVHVDDLDEVTAEDVLRADVDELELLISWDADSLAKQKAFLETLIESGSAAA